MIGVKELEADVGREAAAEWNGEQMGHLRPQLPFGYPPEWKLGKLYPVHAEVNAERGRDL